MDQTPDFYSLLEGDDKTVHFHDALLLLFDKMMNQAGITDPTDLGKLASLRANLDIQLKEF